MRWVVMCMRRLPFGGDPSCRAERRVLQSHVTLYLVDEVQQQKQAASPLATQPHRCPRPLTAALAALALPSPFICYSSCDSLTPRNRRSGGARTNACAVRAPP